MEMKSMKCRVISTALIWLSFVVGTSLIPISSSAVICEKPTNYPTTSQTVSQYGNWVQCACGKKLQTQSAAHCENKRSYTLIDISNNPDSLVCQNFCNDKLQRWACLPVERCWYQ